MDNFAAENSDEKIIYLTGNFFAGTLPPPRENARHPLRETFYR